MNKAIGAARRLVYRVRDSTVPADVARVDQDMATARDVFLHHVQGNALGHVYRGKEDGADEFATVVGMRAMLLDSMTDAEVRKAFLAGVDVASRLLCHIHGSWPAVVEVMASALSSAGLDPRGESAQ